MINSRVSGDILRLPINRPHFPSYPSNNTSKPQSGGALGASSDQVVQVDGRRGVLCFRNVIWWPEIWPLLGLCDTNIETVRMSDQCVDKLEYKRDKSVAALQVYTYLMNNQSSTWHKSMLVNYLLIKALVITFEIHYKTWLVNSVIRNRVMWLILIPIGLECINVHVVALIFPNTDYKFSNTIRQIAPS